MNDQQRAAMQMALEALEEAADGFETASNGGGIDFYAFAKGLQEDITALREALAQPQGEWVDLTDDEIHAAINEPTEDLEVMMWRANYCRAVIAAFKEKNK